MIRLMHSLFRHPLQYWQPAKQQLLAISYLPPWFTLRMTWQGMLRHHLLGLSAALSFYALFALIPLIVLIFFLLSHLVYSSDYAIVKLAILSSNLLPEFSQRIMLEVYHNTQTEAAWGMLGFFILLWTITPLAAHMRASFYLIANRHDLPSFWHKKLHDVLAVLGILLVFFLFTAAGFVLESIVLFLAGHLPPALINLVGSLLSLTLTTLLIAGFYRALCPLSLQWPPLLLAALLTASAWLLMRPAFALFLTVNQEFGAVFGSMKAMFVSITWLYLNFAVFLAGYELLITMREKEVILLKGLFDDLPNHAFYLQALMRIYGKHYQQGDYIYRQGTPGSHYYMVVEGSVHLQQAATTDLPQTVRVLQHGDFFGGFALFSAPLMPFDARVASPSAEVIAIAASEMERLLKQDPQIALKLLRHASHNHA